MNYFDYLGAFDLLNLQKTNQVTSSYYSTTEFLSRSQQLQLLLWFSLWKYLSNWKKQFQEHNSMGNLGTFANAI